jgi:hypothetical protein
MTQILSRALNYLSMGAERKSDRSRRAGRCRQLNYHFGTDSKKGRQPRHYMETANVGATVTRIRPLGCSVASARFVTYIPNRSIKEILGLALTRRFRELLSE